MLSIAVLWLVTMDKEVLLTKRSLTKKLHPGEWGPTVTGTAELDETPDQTLVREVEEELGLTPSDYTPRFLLTKNFNHADGRVRRFSIYCAIVQKEITDQLRMNPSEVADARWFPIDTVREMLVKGSNEFVIVPSAREVWPETFDRIETMINKL